MKIGYNEFNKSMPLNFMVLVILCNLFAAYNEQNFGCNQRNHFWYFFFQFIVLTMIGISNSNKTSYQVGCQSRTNACI